ncbi:MAG TPA: AarF/UbiB family protein [Solirubrobacteraceae bacterium]|nr:AarF/UbiB family protein [Solirubrobacteraceae bacterium]
MSRLTYRERIAERLRMMQIYEVLLRYSSDAMFDRGLFGDLRRALQGWFYSEHLEPLTTPERARLMLQELGPTYVKFGQIVSSRADTLPADWEAELALLQSHVRPFPAEQAHAVIAAELGASADVLYETFDPQPLAAASLAQVHRATLPGGRPVVVKVQRPNIESQVRSDLLILSNAARLAERRSAGAREAGAYEIIEEFGGALMLELDYRLEAYNARRLARNLEGLPGVAVPEVIRELSRQRVLTAEFVPGVEANDREAIIAAGLDPVQVADNAVRAAIKMVLLDGFFHADPHPGNVLVNLDTGTLTFIDTGMVGELGLRQRLNLVGLLYTSTRNDPLAMAQSLRSLSQPFRETDPHAFDADFSRRVGPLMDAPEGEKLDLAEVMSTSLDLLRDAGYRPDPQLSLAMKALTQSSEFMKALYPAGRSSEFSAKAMEMTQDLASGTLTEERVTAFAKKQATYAAREALQQLPSLQEATNMWLRQARKGRFEVKLDTSDLERRMDELRGIARTVTLGIVVVGILIASAIAANAPRTGTFRWVHGVGLVVYVVAIVLAVVFGSELLRRSAVRRRESEARLRRRQGPAGGR